MPYCKKCGSLVNEDSPYCPNCGAAIDTDELILASWGERFVAWLIDMFVLGVVLNWFMWPAFHLLPEGMGMYRNWVPFIDFGFKNIIYFLYWTFTESEYGQSLGKKVMKLRVVDLVGRDLDFNKSAYQAIGKAFLLPLDVLIGWFMYSEKQQRLFNHLSGTIVVKE